MTTTTTTPTTTETAETKSKGAKKKAKDAPVDSPAASADTGPNFAKNTDHPFVLINPRQIRMPDFDSRATDGVLDDAFLASIRQDGVLNPVLLAPLDEKTDAGDQVYLLIAGRRRVRASIQCGFKEIPAHVKPMNLRDAMVAAVNENEQRQDLKPYDRAVSFKRLTELGFSQGEIAQRIGKSNPYVSQHLSILSLDSRVLRMVQAGKFEPGTLTKVRALREIDDPDQQFAVAQKATEDKDNPWRADDIHEAAERIKARAAKKEEAAKKKKPKAAKASGEDESAEDAGAEEEEETETYDRTAIQTPGKKIIAALLEAQHRKVLNLRAKENVDPEKLAYQRGVLDGYERMSGFKALPKSVADDE